MIEHDQERPGLLTTSEAARLPGLHEATFERMARRGDLPAVTIRPRERWRVPREHVETLVHGPEWFETAATRTHA